ncbi:c-type cytochrome [Frigidibacter sp.]|uniref:c-type cytochrome n=1 Tax=Frigidibacter sp. TaxID=2586418 RepID=UPI002736FC23|nr:c-type cytochrome [Frigidibacter sp.]MDP3340941.1 c-type cytochrome [Frigidibacter sp.]
MRRPILTLLVLIIAGGGLGLWITRPQLVSAAALEGLTGEPERGEAVFHAAGCASCHMAPGASGADQIVLAGGQEFPSEFGTFIAPNISPDPEHGIGGWSLQAFASAMTRGSSPEGAHYYPAFPYASYAKAELQDVADLHAFWATLPPSAEPSRPHDVGFPFNIRASLGGWKLLFLNDDWVVEGDLSPEITRGRYLVEALGHCGECHTPRGALGNMDRSRWLAGVPGPDGRGGVPNITPGGLDWSEGEIVEYLTSGFTPDFDSVGGHMALVVSNLARLPESERTAIASYLKTVPAVE